MTRLQNLGTSVCCRQAFAGIEHEDIRKSLVEIVDKAKSGEMFIIVVSIIRDILFTQRGRNCRIADEGSLNLRQTGIKSVVALRGKEKIVIRFRLEKKTSIA